MRGPLTASSATGCKPVHLRSAPSSAGAAKRVHAASACASTPCKAKEVVVMAVGWGRRTTTSNLATEPSVKATRVLSSQQADTSYCLRNVPRNREALLTHNSSRAAIGARRVAESKGSCINSINPSFGLLPRSFGLQGKQERKTKPVRHNLVRRIHTRASANPSGGMEEDSEERYSLTQKQGQRWTEGLRWTSSLPHIDWTRQHLQVLMVDEHHGVRARLAEGLFSRVATWNGFGRVLLSESRGSSENVVEGASLDMQLVSGLLGEARRLGIDSHVMRQQTSQLAREELDIYDLIITMDDRVYRSVMSAIDGEEEDMVYYRRKVRLLTDFKDYCSDDTLLEQGGAALLAEDLGLMLRAGLKEARVDEGPDIRQVPTSASMDEWQHMVNVTLVSSTGLVAYLMDAYPTNLEQQWLE